MSSMSPHGSSPSLQRRILEVQSQMHTKYHPYRKQAAPPPLELCFAARTIGRLSHTDLSLEDVHKGHDFLHHGLSQLPDNVLVKAILAKCAFWDCISQQVSQTLAEIEFIEQQRDLLTEVHTAAQETLATAESQLAMLMDIFDQCDLQDGKDDMAFYHAVYADELVAFTITATQTEQLESFMDKRSPSPDEHVEDNPDHDNDTCGTLFTGLLSSDNNEAE
ncbi:hypothetical protein BKA82DRAFT_35927 [Pisolithus tinctorius]|uniref:Uncharacterized protein n=1 Tax=Pisolithus tinctorius Marx 270 TaxID=870435 RepID=A0A0C3J7G6_PISTI|nr:hypothetical protein BKA82DRAFT_35927 [Pisolithus tinctorius]KIN93621.1 hypothetical protein M404DRAFT_35927 [Pisolithus tinctorius Marx 270]